MSGLEIRPPGFWRGFWIIASLELRQRLRSRALLVLAIVWFCVIGLVTGFAWVTLTALYGAYGGQADGYPLFSLIVYFVLLFGTLVAPAISAGSIGAERSQATLATTQATLVGTWSILLGKAFAAWVTGIAFLVVAAPFVAFSLLVSRAGAVQLLLALLALALQIGVFTVIGVGLSAFVRSTVFAIVLAYLLVALLSVGTLIAFSLAVGASTRYVDVENRVLTQAYYERVDECSMEDDYESCWETVPRECEVQTSPQAYTPVHLYWWILALNPYVVVADMVPVGKDRDAPVDLFGFISLGMRSLQLEPHQPEGWDECRPAGAGLESRGGEDVFEATMPVWWIGLGLQLVLVGGALWGGYRKLRPPAAKLPRGSRVA